MAPSLGGVCGRCETLLTSHDAVAQLHSDDGLPIDCTMERSCGIATLLLQSRYARETKAAVRSSQYVVKAAQGIYEKSMDGNGMRSSNYTGADFNVLLFYFSNIKTRPTGSPVAQAIVGAEPGDPAAAIISSRPAQHDLRSASVYSQIQQWLRECLADHDDCPPYVAGRTLPSRLLNIKGPRLHLCTNSQQEAQYAALSYCWGSPGQKHVLTQQVLEDWSTVGFPTDTLPQTLQDAVEVARGLGLGYLWVDSLCIIQDSPEDMNRELAKMQPFYENAYVTIVAADASVDTGFLGHSTRHPDARAEQDTSVDPFTLPITTPSGALGNLIVENYHEYHPHDHAISRRLWTLQERLLSPRVLIYANHPAHRLLWECQSTLDMAGGYKPGRRGWRSHAHGIGRLQSSIVLDTPPLPLTSSASLPPHTPASTPDPQQQPLIAKPIIAQVIPRPPPLLPSSTTAPLSSSSAATAHTHLAWRTLVEDFSARLVSNPADRLPAVAGLASKFHTALPVGTVYAAGLWLAPGPARTPRHGRDGCRDATTGAGVCDAEFCHALLWQFNRDALGFEFDDDGVVSSGGLFVPGNAAAADSTHDEKAGYVAPTWSWASRRPWLVPNWDWKLRTGRVGWLEPPSPPTCRIIGYHPVLKSEALPYGELRPGTWLEVEGWVRRIRLEWCDEKGRPATWRDAEGEKRRVAIWLLGVAEGRGLLLAKVPGENDGVFVRVRVHGFTAKDREAAEWRRVRLI